MVLKLFLPLHTNLFIRQQNLFCLFHTIVASMLSKYIDSFHTEQTEWWVGVF